MRNWMPPSSVAAAIAPPRASTSLTRCPLPMPRIEGLSSLRRGSRDRAQQQGLAAHARSSQRGLSSGMAAANNDDIETGGIEYGEPPHEKAICKGSDLRRCAAEPSSRPPARVGNRAIKQTTLTPISGSVPGIGGRCGPPMPSFS